MKEIFGYIEIISFDSKCSTDFAEQLSSLKSKGIKSLIIDIRDNGGGVVSEVVNIAETILPKDKVIMRTFDKDGNEEVDTSKGDDNVDMEIVLLVNENSASASEILAGTLKDNEKATLVGTTTFGKGVVQEIFRLKSGGAIKITIQEFKTPNGDKIHETGITPHHVVEEGEDEEKDLQLDKAIELLKK